MSGTHAMSREGIPGVDRDGRREAAGLAGDALAIEDVAGAVDDQDVVGAVAVHVGDEGSRMRVHDHLHGGYQLPVAQVQQHRYVGAAPFDRGQIEPVVACEVPGHQGVWLTTHRVLHGGSERAVTVARQHVHAAVVRGPRFTLVAEIGDGEVEMAIAVEVTQRESFLPKDIAKAGWSDDQALDYGRLEGPISVGQEH